MKLTASFGLVCIRYSPYELCSISVILRYVFVPARLVVLCLRCSKVMCVAVKHQYCLVIIKLYSSNSLPVDYWMTSLNQCLLQLAKCNSVIRQLLCIGPLQQAGLVIRFNSFGGDLWPTFYSCWHGVVFHGTKSTHAVVGNERKSGSPLHQYKSQLTTGQ